MHITELNPESHLNPVVNCADLTKMKVDQLIDQMRQYFQKHNFEDEHGNPSDLTNAVRDVTTCLNNLLNGIKFYDNDNYQTAVEFSAIIENPTVSNKFATLDDAKQEALSSICNVISAIPDLKTEQDKALTTVSRNTLEAAVALSHISAVEPHQHSICIAWVNSITGLIVDSLNNPNDYDNLNVDDVCNTTSMLLNSLGLESYGNFKAALIAAVTKVVQETAKLGFVTQEHNSYSTEGKVATSQAMHLSKLIRVLAPIAEHVDILPQVEQPIQELENTVAVCHNTNSQEVNLQANNTEVAITELRNAIEQFPKSTAFQLRNAVKDIDVMFTDVVTKLDEINNDEEVDDDASEEDPEVVAANAIAALFNKDILNEVVEVSSFAKQLVIASAALQREKIAKDKWLRENRPELFEGGEDNFQYHEGDFDHGLVSAALNVVRAIGALCKASTDMVDGEISPEYLIVTSQFVSIKILNPDTVLEARGPRNKPRGGATSPGAAQGAQGRRKKPRGGARCSGAE